MSPNRWAHVSIPAKSSFAIDRLIKRTVSKFEGSFSTSVWIGTPSAAGLRLRICRLDFCYWKIDVSLAASGFYENLGLQQGSQRAAFADPRVEMFA